MTYSPRFVVLKRLSLSSGFTTCNSVSRSTQRHTLTLRSRVAQSSVASLVGGILADGQKLVRQEVALARREVAETFDKAKTGLALLSGALAVWVVVGVLLGF